MVVVEVLFHYFIATEMLSSVEYLEQSIDQNGIPDLIYFNLGNSYIVIREVHRNQCIIDTKFMQHQNLFLKKGISSNG